MSVPVIAFFNSKGGVGKTTLVYHLAWMFADLGLSVVAADLDPQANLTAAFLDDHAVEKIWEENAELMIYGCLMPLIEGTGDVAQPALFRISDGLALIGGDLRLSSLEEEFASGWAQRLSGSRHAFLVTSALWRIIQEAAKRANANLVVVDLGPNLGSLNRSALVSTDWVVIPISLDPYTLPGLKGVGATLRRWRKEWEDRLSRQPMANIQLPSGRMEPLGYVVLQHSVRLDRPVKAYDTWINRIPTEYRENVLFSKGDAASTIQNDTHNLALIRHYRSLVPMAQEARKPVFHLKPADGAIGAHLQAAHEAYNDFKALALRIADGAGIAIPNAEIFFTNPR